MHQEALVMYSLGSSGAKDQLPGHYQRYLYPHVLQSSARSYIVLTLPPASGRNSERLQGGLGH